MRSLETVLTRGVGLNNSSAMPVPKRGLGREDLNGQRHALEATRARPQPFLTGAHSLRACFTWKAAYGGDRLTWHLIEIVYFRRRRPGLADRSHRGGLEARLDLVLSGDANAAPVTLGHLDGGRLLPEVELIQSLVFRFLVTDVVADHVLIPAYRGRGTKRLDLRRLRSSGLLR
jgi:hypothetical protein